MFLSSLDYSVIRSYKHAKLYLIMFDFKCSLHKLKKKEQKKKTN